MASGVPLGTAMLAVPAETSPVIPRYGAGTHQNPVAGVPERVDRQVVLRARDAGGKRGLVPDRILTCKVLVTRNGGRWIAAHRRYRQILVFLTSTVLVESTDDLLSNRT